MAGESVNTILDNLPMIVGGGSLSVAGIAIVLRKMFVNWSKENVTLQGADTTAAMMQNFHAEIKRLADSNAEFSKENASLRKQISRLEAILEKLAIKFEVDLSEFHE